MNEQIINVSPKYPNDHANESVAESIIISDAIPSMNRPPNNVAIPNAFGSNIGSSLMVTDDELLLDIFNEIKT